MGLLSLTDTRTQPYTFLKLLGMQWTFAPRHESFPSLVISLLVQSCLPPRGWPGSQFSEVGEAQSGK